MNFINDAFQYKIIKKLKAHVFFLVYKIQFW